MSGQNGCSSPAALVYQNASSTDNTVEELTTALPLPDEYPVEALKLPTSTSNPQLFSDGAGRIGEENIRQIEELQFAEGKSPCIFQECSSYNNPSLHLTATTPLTEAASEHRGSRGLNQAVNDDANDTEKCGFGSLRRGEMLVHKFEAAGDADRNMHARSYPITEPALDEEETGEKVGQMGAILARYKHMLEDRTKFHLGYPYNLDFDYGALTQLQHFSINNLGDPFVESNYGVHSRQFEVGVLDWFARLWEIEKEDYWGYITNCGTEGNLHGILLGREVLPEGILYSSKESHYSVFKAARMYRMEVEKVDTLISGEIDCVDLKKRLLLHPGKPAVLNVNIGTTVKGAVDDLDLVIQTLHDVGLTDDQFYIHCDGALFGLMMPFVKKAPKVTFKKPIGSVSVSGHKFVGCPMPCGVQLTRKCHVAALSRNVEYLASRDATIMGSRNGHAPIFLWYTLNRKGYRGFQKEVLRCLRNAHYLKGRLRAGGVGTMLNELSSTVVFERPPQEAFVRKWQLACQGNIAHAVVMPSVSVDKLDRFVDELLQSRAQASPGGRVEAPCIAADIGAENCMCVAHAPAHPADSVSTTDMTRGTQTHYEGRFRKDWSNGSFGDAAALLSGDDNSHKDKATAAHVAVIV